MNVISKIDFVFLYGKNGPHYSLSRTLMSGETGLIKEIVEKHLFCAHLLTLARGMKNKIKYLRTN